MMASCELSLPAALPCAQASRALLYAPPPPSVGALCEPLPSAVASRVLVLPSGRPLVSAELLLSLRHAEPPRLQLPPPPVAASQACRSRPVWLLAVHAPRHRISPSAVAASVALSAEAPSRSLRLSETVATVIDSKGGLLHPRAVLQSWVGIASCSVIAQPVAESSPRGTWM